MMQDFDEDDPPPTVVPSIEVSNATPTVEADQQLDNHNTIDTNPSIEVPNQNLKDNIPIAEEPPLKKCKYSYKEEQDESEDDETSKLVSAMFGKQTTTRCGRKIRSKLAMKNDNVPKTDNDEFIIPHHQEEVSNFKNQKDRIITEKQIISNNQKERIRSSNRKERIRSDNQEERIRPNNGDERILTVNQEERIFPDNEVENIPLDNQKERIRSNNQEKIILPDDQIERITSKNQEILSDDQEKKSSEAKRITSNEEIKVSDSQQQISVNNQEINFEEVLYQNIQDNIEENIRKLMEDNKNNEEDNDDDNDSDSHLVIDLNNINNDEDNTKLNNNNNSEAKLNNLLENYLGSNQTITLELPVVTGDSTEQFKVIIELTSDSDEIVTEDQ